MRKPLYNVGDIVVAYGQRCTIVDIIISDIISYVVETEDKYQCCLREEVLNKVNTFYL